MADELQLTTIGAGTPLVFIHGWGLNSGIWQPLAEKLSHSFKVITIDLPGYGVNVNKTVSPYLLEHISQTIVESIGEPAVYIGWSLGGLFASHIAANYQSQVLGLVTVASSPCFVEQTTNATNIDWPGIKAPLLSAFHQQLALDTKKTINGFLKIQAMGSPQIRQDIKEIQSLIFQYEMPSQQTLADSLLLLETIDLRQTMAKISTPIFRLYGRLDSLVPKAVIPLVAALTPSSEQHIFEHASHAPFISHAEDFYQVLTQWLTDLSAS